MIQRAGAQTEEKLYRPEPRSIIMLRYRRIAGIKSNKQCLFRGLKDQTHTATVPSGIPSTKCCTKHAFAFNTQQSTVYIQRAGLAEYVTHVQQSKYNSALM